VLRLALPVLLVAAVLVGCGGDDAEQTAAPTATAPPAATETATATPTETATPAETATPTPEPENPEDQPGGAGDEEPVRVPVEFTVRDRGISPPQVAVPAFLGIELIVNNELADPIEVRLEGAEPMQVGPGETGRARLAGRRKGQYVIDFGVAGQALLLTGAEPGP
jgi:hypothetical protein